MAKVSYSSETTQQMLPRLPARKVLLTNCFVPSHREYDLLLTEEPAVALDAGDRAQLLNTIPSGESAPVDLYEFECELWDLAYSWFTVGGSDPTVVDGFSAGDLAGYEIGTALIGPFLRGVRLAENFRDSEAYEDGLVDASSLTIAVAGNCADRYRRYESIVLEAFCLALGISSPPAVLSHDPRNLDLAAQYPRSRDVEFLPAAASSRSRWKPLLARFFQASAALSRRPSLLVFEYNPTRHFAQQVLKKRGRAYRLVRCGPPRGEILETLARGDAIWFNPYTSQSEQAETDDAFEFGPRFRLDVRGIDAFPTLAPLLADTLTSYASFIRLNVPRINQMLSQFKVRAVFAPFEIPPVPRLVMLCARGSNIPTFRTTDGFPVFDREAHGRNAAIADHYLAWSEHTNFLWDGPAAHSRGSVTGNPALARRDGSPGQGAWPNKLGTPLRVLLNPISSGVQDSRSFGEILFSEVLRGLEACGLATTIACKPHPADSIDRYRALTTLSIEFHEAGPIDRYFSETDLFISGPSTSLFEAVLAGLPVVLTVPWQTNVAAGLPWDGDEWLERRTARTADDIARLLNDTATLLEPPPAGWLEHYIGPTDSNVTDRILAQIQRYAPSLLNRTP